MGKTQEGFVKATSFFINDEGVLLFHLKKRSSMTTVAVFKAWNCFYLIESEKVQKESGLPVDVTALSPQQSLNAPWLSVPSWPRDI